MMTLNEAKEVFINRAFIPTDDDSGRIYDPDKWREACYVISKWLEQEPCEDDTISRQAGIEGLTELINNLKGIQGDMGSAINAARELIKSLPPVTPQPKKRSENMDEVGVEIVKTEETKESEIKYLNINVSDSEVERNPDIVRLCSDAGVLEYVKPKIGYCRDCKWWKDSDGAFRRGIGAESRCPLNLVEVYEGNGYCFMFEPQESENKE